MKFIINWDKTIYNQNRYVSPATITKFEYILNLYKNSISDIQIISPAMSNKDGKWHMGETIKSPDNITIKYFLNCGKNNFFYKIFNRLSIKFGMFFYLMKNVKYKSNIYIYHTLNLLWVVKFLKKFKKCNITLDVEELYSDLPKNKKWSKKEIKICRMANKFIFPNEYLNKVINNNNKPYVIIHGTYTVQKQISNKYNDDKIHLIYSGTLSKINGGVYNALKSTLFLNEKYFLHIIGYGLQSQINELIDEIKKYQKNTKCKIEFVDKKEGIEYIKYVQKCDIGLSTQNANEQFNNSSFPSKVLSYLSNGLDVVSSKSLVLENSKFKDILYFYDGNDPQRIAEAILNVTPNNNFNRIFVQQLDNEMQKEFLKIL